MLSLQNISLHSKEKFPSIPQALVLDLCCSPSLRHHPNPRSLLLSLDGSSLCWSPILFFILCCHNPPATLIHSWSLARFWIYYFRGRTISGPGCQHAFSRHHGQKSVQLQFYFTLKSKQRLGRPKCFSHFVYYSKALIDLKLVNEAMC